MKISEYIKELEVIMEKEGDLEVQNDTLGWGRGAAPCPEIGYELILRGRESRPRFWYKCDGDERKGSAVCHI